MNSITHVMPVISAAGPLAAPAHTPFIARTVGALLCLKKTSGNTVPDPKTNGPEWLYAEDEYFPFDADSFEER